VDLAALESYEGRWDEAYRSLDDCRDGLRKREEPGPAKLARALSSGSWHGTRGELDVLLGLPDRAATSFAEEQEIARETEDPLLYWNAFEHQLQLHLALYDFPGVLRLVSDAREGQGYAEVPQDLRDKHRLFEAAALCELERRNERPAGKAVPMLRDLVTGSQLATPYLCE